MASPSVVKDTPIFPELAREGNAFLGILEESW